MDLVKELKDMTFLDWTEQKLSPGTPGCFLKAYEAQHKPMVKPLRLCLPGRMSARIKSTEYSLCHFVHIQIHILQIICQKRPEENGAAIWSLLLASGYLKVESVAHAGDEEETKYTLSRRVFHFKLKQVGIPFAVSGFHHHVISPESTFPITEEFIISYRITIVIEVFLAMSVLMNLL